MLKRTSRRKAAARRAPPPQATKSPATTAVPVAEVAPVRKPVTTCKRCNESLFDWNEVEHVDARLGTDHICKQCWLDVWDVAVRFVFEYGIPRFVEERMRTPQVLKRLRQWFGWGSYGKRMGPACVVYFVPRAKTERLEWQVEWHRGEPWSYRGYCAHHYIVVIVDDEWVETADSVEWLTYHELGHFEQQRNARMSDNAWEEENKTEGRTTYEWKDDAAHEADSEERHVNRVATAFMGGKEYARPWWRARVNALKAGEPVGNFPDPHHGTEVKC